MTSLIVGKKDTFLVETTGSAAMSEMPLQSPAALPHPTPLPRRRRRMLGGTVVAGAIILASAFGLGWTFGRPNAPPKDTNPAKDADALLDELGRKGFRWFQANRNPKNGLVRDRGPNWKGRGKPSGPVSIASIGYFLSVLPEAVRRGEISRGKAKAQALRVLRFAARHLEHHHGLFYHFVDWDTGRRFAFTKDAKSEVSVLDSAIFFNGCMVAAVAFGRPVVTVANKLVDRADWTKFLVRHPKTGKKVLAFGWTPEKGLVGLADIRSSEIAMAYFLAAGSRTHPIKPRYWYHTKVVYGKVSGYRILNPTHSLFTSYYGLGWHRLQGLVDRDGVDLDANARRAALANRAFCRAIARDHPTYAKANGGWWGLSAGDSPKGYVGHGPVKGQPDGTVWPTAALAALPWLKKELRADLARWKASPAWKKANGDYGLAPFNLTKKWVGKDLIGIDVGSFLVSLANVRNQTIWDLWMRHPVAVRALQRLGYK
jgi:hypothetical protein